MILMGALVQSLVWKPFYSFTFVSIKAIERWKSQESFWKRSNSLYWRRKITTEDFILDTILLKVQCLPAFLAWNARIIYKNRGKRTSVNAVNYFDRKSLWEEPSYWTLSLLRDSERSTYTSNLATYLFEPPPTSVEKVEKVIYQLIQEDERDVAAVKQIVSTSEQLNDVEYMRGPHRFLTFVLPVDMNPNYFAWTIGNVQVNHGTFQENTRRFYAFRNRELLRSPYLFWNGCKPFLSQKTYQLGKIISKSKR